MRTATTTAAHPDPFTEVSVKPSPAVTEASGPGAESLYALVSGANTLRLLCGLVELLEAVGHGVTLCIEPAPATLAVLPLLEMLALGILAHEQVIAPLFVVQGIGVQRACDMCLATTAEFAFGAGSAPGAGDEQHQQVAISGPLRPRRARPRAHRW